MKMLHYVTAAALACAAVAAMLFSGGCEYFGQQNNQAQIISQTAQPYQPARKFLSIDGPTFAVQDSPGVYRTVEIKSLYVEFDPNMPPQRMNTLAVYIQTKRNLIKDATQRAIVNMGYKGLPDEDRRGGMEGMVRGEILRILNGLATEKDILGVSFIEWHVSG